MIKLFSRPHRFTWVVILVSVSRLFVEILQASTPATITAYAGNNQITPPTWEFPQKLQAKVADSEGNPVSNEVVQFNAPADGASGIFADSGTYTTTATTDLSGIASAAVFTANNLRGTYVVSATIAGVSDPANFTLKNIAWYVSLAGNDSNDCQTPETACVSIDQAVDYRASANGTVFVTAEEYHRVGYSDYIFTIFNKAIHISGGWDSSFSTPTGYTIANGNGVAGGMVTNAPTTIERFIFKNNYADPYYSDRWGAGINATAGRLVFRDGAVINSKTTASGGGISAKNTQVILTNVTIGYNQAKGNGGGINLIAEGGSASLSLYNVTVFGNKAVGGMSSGGGIYNQGGQVSLRNSLIAGNTAEWQSPDCMGTFTSLGYNLLGNTNGCSFTPEAGDILNLDAKLLPLAVGAGVIPLKQGSPALDSANPSGCLDGNGALIATDQRGVARNGRCDIGAYEAIPAGPVAQVLIASGTPQTTPPGTVFTTPLQALVVDGLGTPASDLSVVFAAPASGPSGAFASSGSYITTLITDGNGLTAPEAFTANTQLGDYMVEAGAAGITGTVSIELHNMAWYVSTAGSNANDCHAPATACKTIAYVLANSGLQNGDPIYVTSGTFTESTSPMFSINKSITLSGGWNTGFSAQDGYTILNGGDARRIIYIFDGVSPTLERLVITHSGDYGFINYGTTILRDSTVSWHNVGIENIGWLTLQRSTVQNNFSWEPSGGGINNYRNAVLRVYESTIISNTTSGAGGGIWNEGNVIVVNSTIAKNVVIRDTSASYGGGIYHAGNGLKLINTTIAYNEGGYKGGGVYGGAILQNTIIANNSADEGPDLMGTFTSVGYNLIGDTTFATIYSLPGDKLDEDPLLGTLGDHGGLTWTYPLTSRSPALDGGNPLGCLGHQNEALAIDQRGEPRPQDGNLDGVSVCDIGAYESDSNPPPSPPVTTWYVTTTGSNSNNCKEVTRPCKTIPGAIAKALANDTILVGKGTYSGTTNPLVTVDKNLTISGGWNTAFTDQTDASTLDGGKQRQLMLVKTQVKLKLDHFTIQNGKTTTDGAGIYIEARSRVTMRNMLFQYNLAFRSGGGLFTSENSNIKIYDSEFTSNQAPSAEGGGLYGVRSTFTIENTSFKTNTSTEGGGLSIVNDSVTTMKNCLVSENSSGDGGGISGHNATINLENTTVTNNTALYSGGGIYGTTINMTSSTISHNSAQSGGGIYNWWISVFWNSAILYNSAEVGGGVYANHDITMNNVTMYGNQAALEGGALFRAFGNIYLNNATIALNHAGTYGGGLRYGPFYLRNSILTGNTAPTGPDCSAPAEYSVTSAGYNLLGTTNNCPFVAQPSDRIGVNPMMYIPYYDAPFFIPLPSSPVIDAGNPAGCTTQSGALITVDQRGFLRPADSDRNGIPICEIGAYEVWPATFLPIIRK